jgi:hypothetical protein
LENLSTTASTTQILLILGKRKGKVHPCTGTEALYTPYGP